MVKLKLYIAGWVEVDGEGLPNTVFSALYKFLEAFFLNTDIRITRKTTAISIVINSEMLLFIVTISAIERDMCTVP